jgi:hypothetical protein
LPADFCSHDHSQFTVADSLLGHWGFGLRYVPHVFSCTIPKQIYQSNCFIEFPVCHCIGRVKITHFFTPPVFGSRSHGAPNHPHTFSLRTSLLSQVPQLSILPPTWCSAAWLFADLPLPPATSRTFRSSKLQHTKTSLTHQNLSRSLPPPHCQFSWQSCLQHSAAERMPYTPNFPSAGYSRDTVYTHYPSLSGHIK